MPLDILLLGGVVAAVLCYVAVFGAPKKAPAERPDVWKAVAERRCGTDSGPTSAPSPQSADRTLEVRVAHVMVRTELHRGGVSEGFMYRTIAQARWAIGRGPVFTLRPRRSTSGFGSLEVQAGLQDEAFSRAFLATSDDYAGAYGWFSPPVRQRLIKVLRDATVRSDGEHLSLTVFGQLRTEREIDALLDVVGHVASTGANALDSYTSMPGTEFSGASGTWPEATPPELRIATPDGVCMARLRWVDGVPIPWLSYPMRGGFPVLNATIHAGRAPDMPAGLLSEYANRLLSELQGAQIRTWGEQLEMRWKAPPAPPGPACGIQAAGRNHGHL